MKISERKRELLAAVRERCEGLEELTPLADPEISRKFGHPIREEVLVYRQTGCCRSDFGSLFQRRPTRSESASHSRNVKQLFEAGLIEIHRDGADRDFITHMKLTGEGEKALSSVRDGMREQTPVDAPRASQGP